jgi:restriction system protein
MALVNPQQRKYWTMRELIKGWLGEKMTTFGMWLKLDREVYRRVHNVILPARNGTTQIENPLRQNYRHTRCLAEFLGLNHDLLHSVVFFIGDAQLRTTLPGNVLTEGLSSYIKSFTRPVLTPARVVEIEDQLQALTAGSTISRSEHLQSLDRRRESVTTCPKCGGELIKRLAKRGAMAGNGFYGCANYPRCRYTKNA